MLKNILIVVTIIVGIIVIGYVLSQPPTNDVESTTPTPANQELNVQFI